MSETIYTDELASLICERIADGEYLRVICRDPGMPKWRTVYHWIEDKPDFAERMEKARQIGADAIAEQSMIEVEMEPERINTEHGDKIDPGHVAVMKLRADHRLKMLAKWHKGKYGERVSQELSGPNGGPIETLNKSPLKATDDELVRIAKSGG